jgi:CubicO group peptidase (beta-lactamase class C family)
MRQHLVMDVSSPSAQAVEPQGIAGFLDAVERDPRVEPHGVIIQRHGQRIVEGYWRPHADDVRLVYSLSKTFTGTALGLQLGEGRLGLDDLVSDHLPDLFDGVEPATRRMKIRHIASMASGHDRETITEARAIKSRARCSRTTSPR